MEMKVGLVAAGFLLLLGTVAGAATKGKCLQKGLQMSGGTTTVTLECETDDGSALPGAVVWHFDGSVISNGGKYAISGTNNYKLVVTVSDQAEITDKAFACKPGALAISDPKYVFGQAPATTTTASPSSGEVARVSLMTIGFVLLLSTLLMKG